MGGNQVPAWSGRATADQLHLHWGAGVAIALCTLLLAGCDTGRPTAAAAPQVVVNSGDLIGKWGLASYRVDTDLPRTEKAARQACSNPYVVTKGATGGVMMYLADQSVPQEVFLKTASDGSVYIGPQGKPGDKSDRQVVSYDNGTMVTRWVNPDVAKRYGTMVFVRCAVA